jgi:predicted transposase/invertase (TIGR01784 family)
MEEKMAGTKKTNNDDLILTPINDVAFKAIFASKENEACLCSLLEGFLGEEEEIPEAKIISTSPTSRFLREKVPIFDLRAKLKSGMEVNVEIQLLNRGYIQERVFYYWNRIYSTQLKRGEHFGLLKPVYSIAILNFENFPEIPNQFFHPYSLRHEVLNTPLFQDRPAQAKFFFLELPKVPDKFSQPPKKLELWARFLKSKTSFSNLGVNMNAAKELFMKENMKDFYGHKQIEKAFSTLFDLGLNAEQRREYENAFKATKDMELTDRWHEEERLKREIASLAKGKQEGKAEGKAQGEHEKALANLQKLSQKKFPFVKQDTLQKLRELNTETLDDLIILILDVETQLKWEEEINSRLP